MRYFTLPNNRLLLLTEKGFFSFGIKSSVTKWLNPDATEADLGEKMQAYYDEDKKVWVFPGEDPAEVAKPIGPPPTTPMAAAASTPALSNDPLAAMMAPPQRAPRALGKKAMPGSMPPLPGTPMGAPPPRFTVFAPKPDEGKKENKQPDDEGN